MKIRIFAHENNEKMNRRHFYNLFCLCIISTAYALPQRHWTVADGLPTGEVQQIVQLPNGQMLINCEGVFCLSNGHDFDPLPCDYRLAFNLPHYTNRYGQFWEADSILWLRDFYRIYRFDARTYTFAKADENNLKGALLQSILDNKADTPTPNTARRDSVATIIPTTARRDSVATIIDSLHIHNTTTATTDRQGGLWIGTRYNGIIYLPPFRIKPIIHTNNDTIITAARNASLRSANTTFIIQLPDNRKLHCQQLCHLSYILPGQQAPIALNDKIPALKKYRFMVGAVNLQQQWVAIYTQNGAFLLNTKTDTIAPFPHATHIERYSTKYNCILTDTSGNLWVGTQNGLFFMQSGSRFRRDQQPTHISQTYLPPTRIQGLANNCIRSLVLDHHGHLWAGTSSGIARITPSLINLTTDDGIPTTTMMDRAAILLHDHRLVFAYDPATAISFHPDQLIQENPPLPVVITKTQAPPPTTAGRDSVATTTPRLSTLHPHPLPHNQNNITFYFSTLNYATPSHDTYRYRLRPIENHWNISADRSGQAQATYKALPPGEYTFEVQAANTSRQWGPLTTQTFIITPPWWQTTCAKTIYLLIILTALIAATNIYLKKKRQRLIAENDERVNRLFELRQQARHQFAASANIAPDKITVNADEEKLVTMMLKAIQLHINDQQYNADLLARDVAMSRASLYKKMQNILGITPTDFIRNVRLKRAAQMLAESQLSITEIADSVGFATPRNFSASFKKMFGVLPSEYRTGKSSSKE